MTSLAEILAEPEAINEPWFIESKDRDPASEIDRQTTFLKLLNMLGPRCFVWAVPNAAKRTIWAANKAKREGMKAGVPDLTIGWAGGIFFAEIKDGKSMPTPPQREMLNRLYRAEHQCGVYRQPITLINHLRHAGAPIAKART